MRELDDRYRNDPEFRNMVDFCRHQYASGGLSPGEIRSAATYAALMWEMTRTDARFVYDPATKELTVVRP